MKMITRSDPDQIFWSFCLINVFLLGQMSGHSRLNCASSLFLDRGGTFGPADWFILLPNGESLFSLAAAAAAGCVARGVFCKRGGDLKRISSQFREQPSYFPQTPGEIDKRRSALTQVHYI